MKTSDLIGHALDWAVAKCEKNWAFEPDGCDSYSTDWALGGPIIEREKIGFKYSGAALDFVAWVNGQLSTKHDQYGPTPLIAAMRCYVASNLGDEIQIPSEL